MGNGGWSPKFETVAVGKVGERHPEKTDRLSTLHLPSPPNYLPSRTVGNLAALIREDRLKDITLPQPHPYPL